MTEDNELPEISTLHGIFAQGRAEPETVTIFRGWTRLTTDPYGEMRGQPLQGFFAAETQFLTRYAIRVNGKPLSHRFSVQLSANEWSTTGAVPGSGDAGNIEEGTIPKGSIEVRLLRRVDQGWAELIFVRNNGEPERNIDLELSLSCPIHDAEFSEEMKQDELSRVPGRSPRMFRRPDFLGCRFERNFGKRKRAPTGELNAIYGGKSPRDGDPVMRALEMLARIRSGGPDARLRIRPGRKTSITLSSRLPSRGEICLEIRYEPIINDIRLAAPQLDGLSPLPRRRRIGQSAPLEIQSSNSTFNLVLGQAMSDLRALRLPIFGSTVIPNPLDFDAILAGVPRYVGLFGRDALITAWQGAIYMPELLASAVARMGLYQGITEDPWRDEEVNRLPHERRLDPRAEAGDINRALYFGDVTSTPFWVLALSALYHWTGNQEAIRRNRKTLEGCCEWILRRLREGGGFIYYAPAEPATTGNNRNQAWKDSGDAIVDGQGRIRVPPLALVEIQGYAYQALVEAGGLLALAGARDHGTMLGDEAARLKARFNKRYWIEARQAYALALDHEGNPLRVRASNMGHCLCTGILDEKNVETVMRDMMSEDLFSGWGIRTLSSNNPAYDPFSYHRGSVWPVENAMIAAGMAARGYHDGALRVITAQLQLAAMFQHMRLPEVISGQPRSEDSPVPGLYSYANLLQAWSVSALLQNLQTILGIYPRAGEGLLYLDPRLPTWLSWIELKNLKVGDSILRVRFWRGQKGVTHWDVIENTGGIEAKQGLPVSAPIGREKRGQGIQPAL